jgi:penicillin-binding protein 1A
MTGIDRVLNIARDAGFTSPHLPADLSLSLGSASVTPLEMAAAYSVFANGGYRIRPYGIKRVTTAAGEILEQHGPEPVPAIAPELVLSIRSVLENVVRAGTGRRAAIAGYETFGKTGTTNEYSDAWFAGGLPGLVTVVYAGHDDHESLGRPGTGGAVAAPVWKAFVEKAVTRLPVREHFVPSGQIMEKVSVCLESGFLATSSCPSTSISLPDGMAPRTTCPLHGGSWEMATSDPEAPMLLLSPKDQEVLGIAKAAVAVYSLSLPEDFVLAGEQVIPPYMMPETEPVLGPKPLGPPQKAEVPVPKDAGQTDKRKERTPEEVETRFQELLKQYGISN